MCENGCWQKRMRRCWVETAVEWQTFVPATRKRNLGPIFSQNILSLYRLPVKKQKQGESGVWLHLVWIISSWICPRHREAVGLGEGFYEVGIVNKQIQKTYRLICYYEGQSGPNGDDGDDAFPFHFWAVVISILCFMKQNVWNWLKGSEFVKRNIVWCGAHLHSLNISQLNHDHANENDDDKWCLWWYKYN